MRGKREEGRERDKEGEAGRWVEGQWVQDGGGARRPQARESFPPQAFAQQINTVQLSFFSP